MVKRLTVTFRYFVVGVVFLLAALVLWLQTGPQSVPWLKQVIAGQLQGSAKGYQVGIGQVEINWSEVSRFGILTVKQLEIRDAQGNLFAAFPEIDVRVQPFNLLTHRPALDTITVQRPRLYMTREENGNIMMGLDQQHASLSVAGLAKLLSSEEASQTLPFDALEIRDAHMQLRDAATQTELTSDAFWLRLSREGAVYGVQFQLPFTQQEKTSLLEGSARRVEDTQDWAFNAHMEAWPMEWACRFATCPENTTIHGSATGKISAHMSAAMALQSVNVALQMDGLHATAPQWFAKPLSMPKVEINADVTDGLSNIIVHRAVLQMAKDTVVNAKGEFRFDEASGWVGQGYADAKNMKIAALEKYWPIMLAPEARQWTVDSLSRGIVKKGEVTVTLKAGDTAQEVMPEHVIDATITVEGMQVDYLPHFPAIRSLDGTVKFSGTAMEVEATKAAMLSGTTLTNVTLHATDLNHPSVPMDIAFAWDAPAADVAELLSIEHFTFEDGLNLNPKTMQGHTSGSLKLGFDAYSEKELKADEIDFSSALYNVEATLKDVAQKNIRNGLDVAGLNSTLTLSNTTLNAKGDITLAGHSVAFEATRDTGGAVMLTASGSIPRSQFKGLGLPDTPFITSGALGVKAKAALHGDTVALQSATLDMTRSAWAIAPISWKKPVGEKGSIAVQLQKDQRYALKINAGDLHATGTITLGGEGGLELQAANLSRVETNLNDFSVDYAEDTTGISLALRGKRLDASDAYAKEENGLLQDFPALRLQLDIGDLVLARASSLHNLKGHLTCDKIRCESAAITGETSGAPFQANIARKAGARILEIKAENAGHFIRALDISDRVFDGKLALSGTYQDAQNPAPLQGRFTITDYTLKNSQVLGRILSIGSLTGLANALTGSGIAFNKLGADIEALKGRILVKDGKASGNSMGFTTEGVVDTATSEIHMKGVLVPAFFINSVVNNIPLIGALAGGEGEGLIAFRYTVDGKYSDPQTSVNPLSGFTPGFLRNIFGIFDKPAPKIERDESEPKPAQETKKPEYIPMRRK